MAHRESRQPKGLNPFGDFVNPAQSAHILYLVEDSVQVISREALGQRP